MGHRQKIIQVVSWYKHAFSKSFKRKYANDLSQQLGCKPSQREIWCIHSLPTEEEDVLNIGIGCINLVIKYICTFLTL